jgi:glycerol-3-phosphate dehydrogenase
MNRTKNLERLQNEHFDICIIGGGASGAGCALDAALRGFKVALIEKEDFAAETSSKSTKLIHGGVRYLEQAFKNLDFAQLRQVKHGLEERHTVIRNAPHLAHPLALITPVYSWIEGLYFTIGLKIYGFFAKNDSLPKAQWLNKIETFEHIPTLTPKLHSSVMYYDGQLDDARYCLALAHAADEAGTAVVNHASITGFEKDSNGKLSKAIFKDNLSENSNLKISAKLFINCTGPHGDSIRLMANPAQEKRLRPSKGVHIMLPPEVLQSQDAMLIPKTKDGRVVFVIPFEGEVMVGTTDDEYRDLEKEPILVEQEIDFLLDTLRPYLAKVPDKSEIKSGFGGLRPLIASSGSKATKKLVRDHEVEYDETSNLLSLLGGKWTTYRLMAKDTIDEACKLLEKETECKTELHYLIGGENYNFENWKTISKKHNLDEDVCQHLLKKYGTKAEDVLQVSDDKKTHERIHKNYPFIKAEVIYTIRVEMACSLRDFFARRIRMELMDWKATIESVEVVADLMADELKWTDSYKEQNINIYKTQLKEFLKSANIK